MANDPQAETTPAAMLGGDARNSSSHSPSGGPPESVTMDSVWRRIAVYLQLRLGLDSLRRRIVAYLVVLSILLLAYVTAVGISVWLMTRPAG